MARKINEQNVLKNIRAKKRELKETNTEINFSTQILDAELIGGNKRCDEVLGEALIYAGKNGKILSLPELIQARMLVNYDDKYWNSQVLTNSEENIGIDYEGRYYEKGKEVLFVIHGGGLIDQEKLTRAYDMRDPVCVTHSQEEFTRMLNGVDQFGNSFPVYTYDDVKKNNCEKCLYDKHGIVLPYELIKDITGRVYHFKRDYLEDAFLLACIGSRSRMGLYYDHCRNYHSKKGLNDLNFCIESFYEELVEEYFGDNQRKPRGSILYSQYNYFGSNILSSDFYSKRSKLFVVKNK